MVNTTKIIAVILIISLFLPGCWSRTEIESLAIIGGLGIDVDKQGGKEKFVLTASIVRPALAGGGTEAGGGGQGKPIYWRVSSLGDTMAEAERNVNLRIPRRVFYGHLRFVLISEKAARKGLTDIFDYLHRNMRIRPRVLVLMTSKRATEELITSSELETTIARQIEEMDRISLAQASKATILDLSETTEELIAPGVDPMVARLTTVTSPPTEPGGDPVKVFRLTGGGVFRIDKFVGWMDAEEIRGLLLATGQAKTGPFSISLHPHPSDDVSIMMARATGNIKVKTKGEEVTANIEIVAEGDLSEYHKTDEIATDEGIKKLEKKFAEEINRQVMKSVKKAQKLNSDVFGFGAQLHRSNPKEWKKFEKKWYEVFPKIKVKTKITAHVRRTGMIANPFKPK